MEYTKNIAVKILNTPWTLVGLGMAILAIPQKVTVHRKPFALVFKVKSLWWLNILLQKANKSKGVRGAAMGNVVLLAPNERPNDLEHELIRVEQFERYPLIFPLLNKIEWLRHGKYASRYSKYEVEAYERTKSVYTGETKSFTLAKEYLGKKVRIFFDRPIGTKHPAHEFVYTVNYGYIPNTLAPDGAPIDVYYLGTNKPLQEAEGICTAVIHRLNDDDDKIVVVPPGVTITDEEITKATHFQEQWFEIEIVR